MSDHTLDVARHAGTGERVGPISRPVTGGSFTLHENVIKGKQSISNFPIVDCSIDIGGV